MTLRVVTDEPADLEHLAAEEETEASGGDGYEFGY